jgi:hypothetical protein
LSELPDRSPAADEPVVSKLRSATEEEVDGWVASDDHGSVNGVVGGIKTQDTYVDATTGSNPREENCAQTPVRLKRSDGATVLKRIDICE